MSDLIQEAFQALKGLNEDIFSFDKEGALDLSKFLTTDMGAQVYDVIDPAAETEEDLQPSYVGKVLLDCNVCHQLIYRDPADIIIDEETGDVNVEEECPHCCQVGGFKVVGQIDPYVDEDEVKVSIDGEDIAVEEKEEITESLDDKETDESSEEDEIARKKSKLENIEFVMYNYLAKELPVEKVEGHDGEYDVKLYDYEPVHLSFDTDWDEWVYDIDGKGPYSHSSYEYLVSDIREIADLKDLNEDVEDGPNIPDDMETFTVKEEEIAFFDDETGDIIVNHDVIGRQPKEGERVTFAFEGEDVKPQGYKFIRSTEDGYQFEYIGEVLTEDFQKATVETGDSVLSMETDDSGKVTVTSEPRKIEESGEEMISPVSDETKEEIEANTETEEESDELDDEEFNLEIADEEEGPVDLEIEEVDEAEFDELGESYLKEVYNNVQSYKTIKGYVNGDRIRLEGLLTFDSGKQFKTNFTFESAEITKKGKFKLLGENVQLAKRKNAFTLIGSVKDKKLCFESLNYNYHARDAKTGDKKRCYGTVKIK